MGAAEKPHDTIAPRGLVPAAREVRSEAMKLPACFVPTSLRSARCDIPEDLESVTTVGLETSAEEVGSNREDIEEVWEAVEELYRAGGHPAIQICVRKHGEVILHRAIGHARGNAPDDPPEAPKVLCDLDTPINIFSASKAICNASS